LHISLSIQGGLTMAVRLLSPTAGLALGLALLPARAPAQSIQTDYDRGFDFSPLKTYAFVEQTRRPNDPLSQNPMNERRGRAAIESQLIAHGYPQAGEIKPDFLVAYHAGRQNKLDIRERGYGPGRWRSRQFDVDQQTEGTLTVDVVDATSHELVWRGTATGTIEPKDADKKIRKAVAKLMDQFAKDVRRKA
jgi:hypothetical protein